MRKDIRPSHDPLCCQRCRQHPTYLFLHENRIVFYKEEVNFISQAFLWFKCGWGSMGFQQLC